MTFIIAAIVVALIVFAIMASQPSDDTQASDHVVVGGSTDIFDHPYHEKREAWRWYDALNNWFGESLRAEPPAREIELRRGHDGIWRPFKYAGVGKSDWYYTYTQGRVWGMGPPSHPTYEHRWSRLGPAEGFVWKQDAERFVDEYVADAGQTLEYSIKH